MADRNRRSMGSPPGTETGPQGLDFPAPHHLPAVLLQVELFFLKTRNTQG